MLLAALQEQLLTGRGQGGSDASGAMTPGVYTHYLLRATRGFASVLARRQQIVRLRRWWLKLLLVASKCVEVNTLLHNSPRAFQ